MANSNIKVNKPLIYESFVGKYLALSGKNSEKSKKQQRSMVDGQSG